MVTQVALKLKKKKVIKKNIGKLSQLNWPQTVISPEAQDVPDGLLLS